MQQFLRRFRPGQFWSMTFAYTCSTPGVGDFGGGAVPVTVDGIEAVDTDYITGQQQKAFASRTARDTMMYARITTRPGTTDAVWRLKFVTLVTLTKERGYGKGGLRGFGWKAGAAPARRILGGMARKSKAEAVASARLACRHRLPGNQGFVRDLPHTAFDRRLADPLQGIDTLTSQAKQRYIQTPNYAHPKPRRPGKGLEDRTGWARA